MKKGPIENFGKEAGSFFLEKALSLLKGDLSRETLHKRTVLLGRLGVRLVASRRRIMLANLRMVFPEWDNAAIERVVGEAVKNICHGFVDLFHYAYHMDRIKDIVRVEKNGVLESLVANRRGYILATGHVGFFPMLGIPLVLNGVPFGPVFRAPHDKRLQDEFDKVVTLAGFTNIPDRPPMTVLKRSLQVLRRGGGVMIAFDMHPADSPAIEVDFCGRKTPMFPLVVRLAARTGLPIVRTQVLKEADGIHYRVTYLPPMEVPPEAAQEGSALTGEILQDLASWLSDIILRNPEQYWWIHRRWRDLTP